MTAEKRVELRGVLEDTVSSASIGGDGSLVVRLFDFSTEAHSFLGRDVAFMLHLSAADKDRVLARLLAQAQAARAPHNGTLLLKLVEMLARLLGKAQAARTPDKDTLLLKLIEERFDDYYAVQEWLKNEGIPFRKEFDRWA